MDRLEITKKCLKCKDIKSIDAFYKHEKAADGHLNMCINCKKEQALNRYNKKKEDPTFLASEAKRKRNAYNNI